MQTAAVLLVGLAGIALAVGLVTAFSRSLIPYGFEGRVESLRYVDGSDLRTHVLDLGEYSVTADSDAVGDLQKGQIVAKEPWSLWLRTESGDEPLWVSGEFLRLVASGGLTVAGVGFLSYRAVRLQRAQREPRFQPRGDGARHWVDDGSG